MNHNFDFSASAIAALAAQDAARALSEDIGTGDLTAGLIEPQRRTTGRIVAREAALICGAPWVEAALRQLDPTVELVWQVGEGQMSQANQTVLQLQGQARALLSAERTALNFLQLLSAVASKTAAFVAALREVPGARASIVDTRKTLPGLRLAQKYAVKTGGGVNHRLGLYDAVLIKENHIAAAGGIQAALQRARQVAPLAQFAQIEVETLQQLELALNCAANMILLDNMNLEQLRQAVRINAGRALLEVSGGVDLTSLRAIAATGVDRISIGDLTKNIRAVDFSMRLDQI